MPVLSDLAPVQFWNQVLVLLEEGIIPDGIEALTLTALKKFPASRKLAEAMQLIKGEAVELPPREAASTANPVSGACANPEVFFSYASPDRASVLAIATALARRGKRIWLDCWCLKPGQNFIEVLQSVLLQTLRYAIFIGPGGLHPWHRSEAYSALQMFAKNPDDVRVILVLLPGASLATVPLFLQQFSAITFGSVGDPRATDDLFRAC
jgi:hypothetical protein